MKTKIIIVTVIALAALFAIAVGVGVGVHNRHERQNRESVIAAPSLGGSTLGAPMRAPCSIQLGSTLGENFTQTSASFADSNLTFNGSEFTVFAPVNGALTRLQDQLNGRNLTTDLRGLLAYHIIPGLYDADNSKLVPNHSANNTVDTALSAILTSPQRVNFTSSNSIATTNTSTTLMTADTGGIASATYVRTMLANRTSSCSWAVYTIDNFLIPRAIRDNATEYTAAGVAARLAQGPLRIKVPTSAETPVIST